MIVSKIGFFKTSLSMVSRILIFYKMATTDSKLEREDNIENDR